MTRVLFISCSKRKSPDVELVPAISRYDGPCFRVLRSYLRDAGKDALLVWVLSAEYGLLQGRNPISSYDRVMTPNRAAALRTSIVATFVSALRTEVFDEAFVCMGATYARVMSDCWHYLPNSVQVYHARGSIGGLASKLKAWLRRDNLDHHINPLGQSNAPKATILGIQIDLTTEEVLAIARERLATDSKAAMRCQTWFVRIGDYCVTPKWLVRQLTELPVSRFRTADACRVLNALGLRVECVWTNILTPLTPN
jgi:hypothetical protein